MAAIQTGHVGGAALDVYERSRPKDQTLQKLPQVVASPHIAASTREGQELVGLETDLDAPRFPEARHDPQLRELPVHSAVKLGLDARRGQRRRNVRSPPAVSRRVTTFSWMSMTVERRPAANRRVGRREGSGRRGSSRSRPSPSAPCVDAMPARRNSAPGRGRLWRGSAALRRRAAPTALRCASSPTGYGRPPNANGLRSGRGARGFCSSLSRSCSVRGATSAAGRGTERTRARRPRPCAASPPGSAAYGRPEAQGQPERADERHGPQLHAAHSTTYREIGLRVHADTARLRLSVDASAAMMRSRTCPTRAPRGDSW